MFITKVTKHFLLRVPIGMLSVPGLDLYDLLTATLSSAPKNPRPQRPEPVRFRFKEYLQPEKTYLFRVPYDGF